MASNLFFSAISSFLQCAFFCAFKASSNRFLSKETCSFLQHIIDCCNSFGRIWNTPQFHSVVWLISHLPVANASCPLPNSLFDQVCPSTVTLSKQRFPATFNPTVDVACMLFEILVDASIPRVAFLSSLDIIAQLSIPPTLVSQSEVAFLGSQNYTRNALATTTVRLQAMLCVCLM